MRPRPNFAFSRLSTARVGAVRHDRLALAAWYRRRMLAGAFATLALRTLACLALASGRA